MSESRLEGDLSALHSQASAPLGSYSRKMLLAQHPIFKSPSPKLSLPTCSHHSCTYIGRCKTLKYGLYI